MIIHRIVALPADTKGEYGCAPCAENERDVDAVAMLEGTYGVLNNPQHTYVCGNHAEVLSLGVRPVEGDSHDRA